MDCEHTNTTINIYIVRDMVSVLYRSNNFCSMIDMTSQYMFRIMLYSAIGWRESIMFTRPIIIRQDYNIINY